jgi:hypothetical protein
MPLTTNQYLQLTSYGLSELVVNQLSEALSAKDFVVQVQQVGQPAEMIRSMVNSLPHLVLFGVDKPGAGLSAALGFIERTFPDVPVLLLSEETLPKPMAGQNVRALQPISSLAEEISRKATAPQTGDQRARRLRIMQQIDKNLSAIAEMEQLLGASNLPVELFASRRYLEQLQAMMRS